MRVLHIITGLNTGGAEMMMLKLLSTLNNNEFELKVISLRDKGTLGPRIEAIGIPVYALGLTSFSSIPAAIYRFVRIIRRFKPNLIQGWMYHGNIAASLAKLFLRTKLPVLWNIRQSLASLSDEKSLTAAIIKLGAQFSDSPAHILYNSQTAASQHQKLGYSAKKSVIIPNGFDTQRFKPDGMARVAIRNELRLSQDAFLIGLVARFHPMKDHKSFLYAASLVLKRYPSVCFVLAGKGVDKYNTELTQWIEDMDLSSAVYLLGERSDVPCITASFDVAVNCSWRGEAFPNAIGEAMSCAVPCVVTDIGDSASIVDNTGKIVRPSDAPALAAAIIELIALAQTERQALGASARRRVIENFSIDHVTAQYAKLYMQCLREEIA